ncbi:ABC transporter substrate-binding protein [uncultured Methylovirgula sp.]|uniref:ABC transporter substrate-binding protein n=1 Tax=uncultured Methylovirgula sp. TaxID=1285960 RepID=UPI002605E026|nr:ABC transporter substrate-binding protein [uncultured Methylovirgula sp.]
MCEHCGIRLSHGAFGRSARGVNRRQALDILAAGGLAAFGASLGGFNSAARAADDEVVRIGYLPITDATALLVAHGMGFFKDEGLEAERPTLIRGWPPLVEAFAAGKFNLVHLLNPIPIWMRYNNHYPVKLMAWAHTNGSSVVVGQASGINSFADFGGKQVAVPFWYSMHNIVLQYALRHSGIKPVIQSQGQSLAPHECNLQVMAPPEMPAALAAKKIDGYIVAEPFDALGELKAGGRILRFTGDIWKNHPCCVVCMHEEVVEKKKEWSQKVINALVRAEVYAATHKKDVAQFLSAQGEHYLPLSAPVIERAMTDYDASIYGKDGAIKHPQWGLGRIDFQPWPYPSATEMMVSAMNETLVGGDTTFLTKLDPKFVSHDLVNYEFVRNAMSKYPQGQESTSDPFSRTEVLSL